MKWVLLFVLVLLCSTMEVQAQDAAVCDPAVLNSQEQITLRRWQVFRFLDKDHNGALSFDEYFASLPAGGAINPQALFKTFGAADHDGSQELSFAEWNTLNPTRYFLKFCRKKNKTGGTP